MGKVIKCGLSVEELDRAIREVESFKQELLKKTNALIEALTDRGAEIAKARVRALGALYTGELEGSIRGYFSPAEGVGIISAGGPKGSSGWYAVYVEYGTGVRGKQTPHPKPGGWVYDVNGHGEAGWWYYNGRDGRMHWTKGMPSRPFMLETARQLEAECQEIAKEVFR